MDYSELSETLYESRFRLRRFFSYAEKQHYVSTHREKH